MIHCPSCKSQADVSNTVYPLCVWRLNSSNVSKDMTIIRSAVQQKFSAKWTCFTKIHVGSNLTHK